MEKCKVSKKLWLMYVHAKRGRDSSDGIEMGYGLDGRGSIPGKGKRFFSTSQHLDRIWGSPGLLYIGYWGLVPLG
jgi:hypothetical protein